MKPNYAAPALQKGLEILQVLAGRASPMNQADIAAELGRSKAEIYRMLLTLEDRNFIRRDEAGTGYEMTSRLFELGMKYPPRQRLTNLALPHMRSLAAISGQSNHLTLVSGKSIVVVARAESTASSGFAVKVGFRVSAIHASSSRVLYAFQAPERQKEWDDWIRSVHPNEDLTSFRYDASLAKEKGFLVRESYYTLGVTDLVAPVISRDDGSALAALVVPYMDQVQNPLALADIVEKLKSAAAQISADI